MNLTFLSDLPEDKCDRDLLGISEHVNEVVNLIRQSDRNHSQNIAIYGDWGKGKTSFLKMVKKRLDEDTECTNQEKTAQGGHIFTIFYQAWRYDSDKYPLESLIGTVVEELSSQKTGWYKKVHDRLEQILAGLAMEASIGVPGLNYSIKYDYEKSLKQKAGKKAKAETHSTAAQKFFNLIDALKELSLKDNTDNKTHLPPTQKAFKQLETLKGRLNSIFRSKYNTDENHLANAQKSCKQTEKKIVLFLDDLDRCQPDVAIRLLEGLKQIFDFPGFFIVMGLNKQILDSYVKKRFEEMGISKGFVHRYFEKLFKTEIDLNDSKVRTDILSFVKHHMQIIQKKICSNFTEKDDYQRYFPDDYWQTIIQIVNIACRQNPRTVIKLLNEYILQINLQCPVKETFEEKNFSQQDFEIEFFNTCLKYAAPSLYAELKKSDVSRDCFLYLQYIYDKENDPFLVNFCNHFTNKEELRPGIELLNTKQGNLWLTSQTKGEQEFDPSFLLRKESLHSPECYQFLLQLIDFYINPVKTKDVTMVNGYFSNTRSTKGLRRILTGLISSQNTHKNIHFCNKLCGMIYDKILQRRYESYSNYIHLPDTEDWKEVYHLCRDLMENLSGSEAESEDVISSLMLYIAFSDALSVTIKVSYRQNINIDDRDEKEWQKVEEICTHLKGRDKEGSGNVHITTIKELLPDDIYQATEEKPAQRVDEAQKILQILFFEKMNSKGDKITQINRQRLWKRVDLRYKKEFRTQPFTEGHVRLLLALARLAVLLNYSEQTRYYKEILETIFNDEKYSLLAKLYAIDMEQFLQLIQETFADTGRKTVIKEFTGPESFKAANLSGKVT